MELYQDEVRFNLFHEKKRRDLKTLSASNDFIKPYLVYYMFKNTIHAEETNNTHRGNLPGHVQQEFTLPQPKSRKLEKVQRRKLFR